ncbi:cell division/cell wall cluster transcriptional repressor MraZ [Candidatus Shapirobacteria bacterium CG_4_9_14_0_2_um_filter_39_11]|uniref:Transcriptional regulator MraZ n=1 Tax=Candidatus Shapirobacteria bacterium CG_4_9_14_0_2_um_filter_39_11 TaxID=1974478 RepID=A0A2M8ESD7_9BACT|nr:MAG: cell division/cell wall cluster transcriptional repressor MraZ [Candidatus Shapirobacteria bacterium CG_4_9_14_0_2_um_filter_39_11]
MFLGTYCPNLIGKGRIALPKKIREQLVSNKIVLTVGFEKCIFGFDEKDWEEIVKPELSRPFFSDAEGRDLRRKMCMEAMVIKLGAQGRIVIPEAMMEYAGIKDKLTLIGAGDHFEIWENSRWVEYKKKIEKENI